MSARIPLYEFMPYGAPELLESARKNMLRAQMLSSLLAVTCFATLALLGSRLRVTLPVGPIPIAHSVLDLPPPGPLQLPPMPSTPVSPPATSPAAGLAVSVPDQLVVNESILPSQADLARISSSQPGEGSESISIPPNTVEEPYPQRGVYVPTDELPAPVREIHPTYPDLARAMGVEGRVVVHVLVGKDGRVVRVEIDPKRSVPLLDGAAIEAARQWVFKPALANNQPVAVWVALPFNFKLRE